MRVNTFIHLMKSRFKYLLNMFSLVTYLSSLPRGVSISSCDTKSKAEGIIMTSDSEL